MTVLNKDKILDAAKDFVTQGKLDKAIREYEKLLAADPSDMRVKLRLAELLAKQRQVPQAIQAYKEVAEQYGHEGFYLKAVTVLKGILRLNPSLSEVNQSLAQLYEKMGLSKDAAHQYQILANAFEQKNEYEKALAARQKMVELFPEEATYRIRLAEAYQREDKKEEAIAQFEVLAKQYKETKQEPKKMIDLYEKILPSRPENKEMFIHLVDLYFEKKDYKAALKWCDQKKQLVAEDPHLLSLQARMYGELNQLDTARSRYQQLAALYGEKGEKEKALEALQEILVLLPEETEAVKEEAEKIEAGQFENILKRAQEKRQRKEKEAEQKAIQEEQERDEKARKAEEAKQQPEGKKKVQAAAKPHPAHVPTPPAKPAAAKVVPAKPKENIEGLLKMARSSLSLIRAYQSTGLAEEAKVEQSHAKKALEKILEIDPNHAEAKKLLQELG